FALSQSARSRVIRIAIDRVAAAVIILAFAFHLFDLDALGQRGEKRLAVKLRDDARIEHRNLAGVGLRADQSADALLETDDGARDLIFAERVAAALLDLLL